MSMSDRLALRKRQRTEADTPSSTLAQVDPPIVQRLRLLFTEVREQSQLVNAGKMGWLIDSVMDEVLDILVEQEREDDMAKILVLASRILKWVATGEIDDLPEELKARALAIAAEHPLELPAGEPVDAH
jgi:hypothetical protein